MAVAGAPWQLECETLEQRCGYLLTSAQWSDCTFVIGSETNQEVVPAHKLVLAMASPVFEAMFYGGLSEHNEPIVSIPDVPPEVFRALLKFQSREEDLPSGLPSHPNLLVVTLLNNELGSEEPSIHTALQKIRFLSLTAEQFAEGPARSGLLTKDETFALVLNIASRDSPVPMPPGFSACRERRQTRNDSNQCFVAGSLDHTIHALKCGDPSQVKDAARAAYNILDTPGNIQPALDKGILDALVPALTEGSDKCKQNAAWAICRLCEFGSPSQLSVLAASAALEPYCRLLTAGGDTCLWVLDGLTHLMEKVEENTKVALLLKLREIGVPQLLMAVQRDGHEDDRQSANNLLRTYFDNGQ